MEKCEINNKTELNLYCNLLSVAYELYKDKTNGMVCGSEAENIRDKMYKAIKEAGIIDTKWRFNWEMEAIKIMKLVVTTMFYVDDNISGDEIEEIRNQFEEVAHDNNMYGQVKVIIEEKEGWLLWNIIGFMEKMTVRTIMK